jgi:hypothetical protein
VVFSGKRLMVEGAATQSELDVLADAVADSVEPPYRAEAIRRHGTLWAVAARTIEVAELPSGTPGDAVTISVQGDEHTTLVDGAEWFASLPALEALAGERGLSDYVLEASRLDGDLWEVRVSAL